MADQAPTVVIDSTDYRPPKYSPSLIVSQLHGYYHHGGASSFAPFDERYQMALAGFFALPLAVGCLLSLALIALQCGVACCPRRCRCCAPRAVNWAARRRRMFVLGALLMAAVLLMGSWVGRNNFQSAASTLRWIVSSDDPVNAPGLADLLQALETDSGKLKAQADAVVAGVAALETSGCKQPDGPWAPTADGVAARTADNAKFDQGVTPAISLLKQNSGAFGKAGDTLGKMFVGLAPTVRSVNDMPLELYVDIGLGCSMGQVLLVLAIGAVGLWFVWPRTLGVATTKGSFALLTFSFLVALEVFISVLLADFCTAGPLPATAGLAANMLTEAQSQQMAAYFLTCNGTNPIAAPLRQAQTMIPRITSAVGQLGAQTYSTGATLCDAAAVKAVVDAAGATSAAISGIVASMGCDRVNPVLVRITHELLCVDVVHGMYNLWVVQASAAALFFVCVYGMWNVHYCVKRPEDFPLDPAEMAAKKGQIEQQKREEKKEKEKRRSDAREKRRSEAEKRKVRRSGAAGGTVEEGEEPEFTELDMELDTETEEEKQEEEAAIVVVANAEVVEASDIDMVKAPPAAATPAVNRKRSVAQNTLFKLAQARLGEQGSSTSNSNSDSSSDSSSDSGEGSGEGGGSETGGGRAVAAAGTPAAVQRKRSVQQNTVFQLAQVQPLVHDEGTSDSSSEDGGSGGSGQGHGEQHGVPARPPLVPNHSEGGGGGDRSGHGAGAGAGGYAHYEHVFVFAEDVGEVARAASTPRRDSNAGVSGAAAPTPAVATPTNGLTLHASMLTGRESPDEVIF
eukprot:g5590.t1